MSSAVPEPLWLIEAKRTYIASLPGKLSVLWSLLAALDQERTGANRRELFDAFHRIEGSAASYGCDRLGEIAAECSELLSNDWPTTAEDIDALRVHIAQLAQAADRLTVPAEAPPSPALRSVLVVDDDPAVQATLQRLLEREGFAVQLASSCAEGEAMLERSLPTAAVLDVRLGDRSGIELLTGLRQRDPAHRVPAIILSAVGNFDTKLDAVRRGCDAYFEKPFEWEAVIRKLRTLLDPADCDGSRILVVEDDVEQAAFVGNVLADAGYSVRICADAACIDETMVSFPPDLILLDVHLPSGSGLDIARYLRQRDAAVPIVFLTATQDPTIEMDAIDAGGDDFLRKPVSRELLLVSVAARLRRAAQVKSLLDHDSLTGVLTHGAIAERIAHFAAVKRRNPHSELSLIMLDLDHFKQVNDQHGHLTGDRVLSSLGGFLRRSIRDVDVVGRHGGEEFAIILDASAPAAAAVARKLLETFFAIEHVSDDQQTFHVSFTAGVAELERGMSAQAWKLAADRALLAAKEAGRKQIMVAPSAAPPTLDEATLASLRELGVRAGVPLIAELTDLFFRMLPERLATLEESAARGDAVRLERTAHNLRSAAGNLGARKLASLCGELERLALTAPTEANTTLVDGIVAEAGRVAAALREL